MTVLDHVIAAGYDPSEAAGSLYDGTSECALAEIRTSMCRPYVCGGGWALMVEATAIVPWTDGVMRPMGIGWGGDADRIILYIPKPNYNPA